jgi:hypothetical protein
MFCYEIADIVIVQPAVRRRFRFGAERSTESNRIVAPTNADTPGRILAGTRSLAGARVAGCAGSVARIQNSSRAAAARDSTSE